MELKLEKVRYFLAGTLAICWSLFQIYGVWNVTLDAMILRAAHVGFALSLAFVLNPSFKSRPRLSFAIDSIFMLLGIGVGLHVITNFDRIIQRIISVDEMTFSDLFFGFIAIPLILEATRRTVRAALAIVGNMNGLNIFISLLTASLGSPPVFRPLLSSFLSFLSLFLEEPK
jgi:TRAP-type uncharacterized transport system fused permease subunit